MYTVIIQLSIVVPRSNLRYGFPPVINWVTLIQLEPYVFQLKPKQFLFTCIKHDYIQLRCINESS